MNASPDIRQQIEGFPPLLPESSALRGSRVEGVLLTNADLDHVLGLLVIREGEPLPVVGPPPVRTALNLGLQIEPVLSRYCGIRWRDAVNEWSLLPLRNGEPSGLSFRAIALPGKPPKYMGDHAVEMGSDSVAYQFRDDRSGSRVVVAPDVADIPESMDAAMAESDALLFDGTFWSENELRMIDPLARTASEMGHLPVEWSLSRLRQYRASRKILVHINNTNPVLDPDTEECAKVKASGVEIGEDAMQFEL